MKKQLNITIEQSTLEKVVEKSKKENRNISNTIDYILITYFKNEAINGL